MQCGHWCCCCCGCWHWCCCCCCWIWKDNSEGLVGVEGVVADADRPEKQERGPGQSHRPPGFPFIIIIMVIIHRHLINFYGCLPFWCPPITASMPHRRTSGLLWGPSIHQCKCQVWQLFLLIDSMNPSPYWHTERLLSSDHEQEIDCLDHHHKALPKQPLNRLSGPFFALPFYVYIPCFTFHLN